MRMVAFSTPLVVIVGVLGLFLQSIDGRLHEPVRRLGVPAELEQRLTTALDQLNKAANLIYQRFELHHWKAAQFFMESSNMPVYGWDLIKNRIAKKILLGNASYVMIFGGSSVTAGHDNYYNQSYPFVFERRLKDVFTSLGVRLEVRNIAQGANNCRPSNYCYEGMGGEDADFIGWEQSFNCGRNRDIHEMVARVAHWAKGVVYYEASGAFMTSECGPSSDPLYWTSEDWTPEKAGITSKYSINWEAAQAYRQLSGDWYDDGNSVSRFTNQVYGGTYKGVGPHGYSVWGHSSKLCNNGTGCNAIDMRGDCHERGGPHWMVAETSYYAGEKDRHGKSWHPPAGMHLMRGEVHAYNMAHVLVDTVFTVLHDLKTLSKEEAIAKYDKAWQELYFPMPEKGLHLSAEESNFKPLCFTNYRPHFNPKGLIDNLIVGKKGFVYVDNKPVDGNPYGYADERPYYEGIGPGKEISFRISNVRAGAVRVCGYDRKESLNHAAFFLDPAYAFKEGEPYTPTDKLYELTTHIYMQDECTRLPDIPNGPDEHVLTVRTKPDGRPVSVSHVIIF